MKKKLFTALLILLTTTAFAENWADLTEADWTNLTVEDVNRIIRNGADPRWQDEDGYPVIGYMLELSNDEVTASMFQHWLDPNESVMAGFTPLALAVMNQNHDLIHTLIELGADSNRRFSFAEYNNISLFSIAVLDGDIRILETILNETDIDPAILKQDAGEALAMAIDKGALDSAWKLLNQGADPDGFYDGLSSLMLAVDYEEPELVRALLDAGADVNAVDDEGWTALMVAADTNSARIVKLLLEYGADRTIANMDGETPLVYAMNYNRSAVIQLLKVNKGMKIHPSVFINTDPEGLYQRIEFLNDNQCIVTDSVQHKGFPTNYYLSGKWVNIRTDKSDLRFEVLDDITMKGQFYSRGIYIRQ